MASYVDILKSEFPQIDTELFDYITGTFTGFPALPQPGRERLEPAAELSVSRAAVEAALELTSPGQRRLRLLSPGQRRLRLLYIYLIVFCSSGVLDSGGSDFEDAEEVFDAVGGFLQEVSSDTKNEDDIRDVCLQMFNCLKLNNCHGSKQQTWASTILVVSHDRNFLNAVVTDIVHLHSQRLDSYRGDYENFIKTKEDRLKNQQRKYEAQLQYRQHIQVFIDRFRYNANRAAQVQSKLKLLEKLPELKPLEKETEVLLRFPDQFEKLSPPILQLDEVEFYYNQDQRLFTGLNLSADLDSRICIVGENGAGKTTVLKLLMGELTPINGVRQAHRNLKIGYFSQHHVDQLDLNVCSVELLANKFPGRPEEEYRHQLGRYGVTGELATRPVASLSGGQKSRVAFAQMTMPCPNFYILDEPTNHLDMETIEALAKALNKFKGGVVLVSHDERLIRLVCRELWVCENGRVSRIDGGFDEYKHILHEQFRKEGYL
ncbi:hypothetical protein WMY93_031784 [Mugilogobius chulae]|uniref:ABC transporter domain-containing protein n=1 Tax=Mugilogobius chulae TaxID=88201 RepID=A0AAW0MHD0_9GOBI